MLRDDESNLAASCEIVETLIASSVESFYKYFSDPEHSRAPDSFNMHQAMRQIHHYLIAKPDLLMKRTIFFIRNRRHDHWWGWLALNPWKQLLDAYDESLETGFRCA